MSNINLTTIVNRLMFNKTAACVVTSVVLLGAFVSPAYSFEIKEFPYNSLLSAVHNQQKIEYKAKVVNRLFADGTTKTIGIINVSGHDRESNQKKIEALTQLIKAKKFKKQANRFVTYVINNIKNFNTNLHKNNTSSRRLVGASGGYKKFSVGKEVCLTYVNDHLNNPSITHQTIFGNPIPEKKYTEIANTGDFFISSADYEKTFAQYHENYHCIFSSTDILDQFFEDKENSNDYITFINELAADIGGIIETSEREKHIDDLIKLRTKKIQIDHATGSMLMYIKDNMYSIQWPKKTNKYSIEAQKLAINLIKKGLKEGFIISEKEFNLNVKELDEYRQENGVTTALKEEVVDKMTWGLYGQYSKEAAVNNVTAYEERDKDLGIVLEF